MKSYATTLLVFLCAGLLLWSLVLHALPDHATLANYLFNIGYALLYLFGAVVALRAYATLGKEGVVARGFFYLGLSFLSYTAGQALWTYYNVRGIEVPYPSFADLFFVLFIPFTAVALSKFFSIYRILVTRRVVIESVLIFLAASAAIIFVQGPTELFAEVPMLERVFNLLYPLTDAFLITAALVVIRSSGGTLRGGLVLLAGGYIVGALADFTFAYRTAVETYWNGDIADILFMFSAFFLALAAVKLSQEFAAGRATGQA